MGRTRSSAAIKMTTVLALCLGSLQVAAADPVSFRRGDSNGDGVRDLADPVHSLLFLFRGGAAPTCKKAADSNDDGTVDLSDAVYTLGFLFLGEAPPPAPFPGCGLDVTSDELTCESYAACADAVVYANLQIDAEEDDVAGLERLIALCKERGILTTVYVSADYANRNALLVSDIYNQGFEMALHGYYTGEQLATMTYEEQKDLLGRAKKAVEGCRPCGNFKPVVGFRPQYFSQNEDTYRILDELGLTHNSGFKVRQIFFPGHEWDEAPYKAPGHGFAVVPITTIPHGDNRIYLCDIACANTLKMTGAQWREVLMTGLSQCLEHREPLVLLLHNWYTGDSEKYDYWQPLVDLLDAATGKVVFVSTQELVDRYVN